MGEYGNGLKILDIIEAFLSRQSSEGNEHVKSMENVAKLKNHYQAMSLSMTEIYHLENTESVRVSIQTEPLIIFPAQYNQTLLKTAFDTGAAFPFFIEKRNVEKVGVRIEPHPDIMLNGEATRSTYGIIDSVRIGSLLIKNAPVLVLENEFFYVTQISFSNDYFIIGWRRT
jgi:hypothetical protein